MLAFVHGLDLLQLICAVAHHLGGQLAGRNSWVRAPHERRMGRSRLFLVIFQFGHTIRAFALQPVEEENSHHWFASPHGSY